MNTFFSRIELLEGKTILKMVCLLILITSSLSCKMNLFRSSSKASSFTVISPNGRVAIEVLTDERGQLAYRVLSDKVVLIPESKLGVVSAEQGYTFSEGLTFVSVRKETIRETYELPTGKTHIYHNNGNEGIYSFRNASGHILEFVCRAYDDGVAFRYKIKKDGKINITSEKTSFRIADNSTTWMMDFSDVYENYFPRRKYGNIKDKELSYPALIKTKDHWMLITEAGIFKHPGTHLAKAKDGSMNIRFPEKSFTVEKEYESPWRTVIIGSRLKTIVESVLVENLSPPSVINDLSWIEPGVAVFPWWADFSANSNIDTLKTYVDLAVKMNWKWFEFDVALVGSKKISKTWRTMPWLKDFVAYANAKGLNVYGWEGYDALKTKEERDYIYSKYKEWGIKGIKIDYLKGDSIHMMKFREDALKEAMDYNLMVSFHGETLPRGQRRKYPNLMTCEAVLGAEYYAFATPIIPTPEHNCVLPFTRNVVGSMDYTPATFTIRNENPRTTTYAHELALPFVFESGWMVMADRPSAYLNSPARDLLTKVKATWDETRFIDGYPGKFACIARRHGSEWYLAAINAGKEVTIKVKLDFLKEGKYTFDIYEDDKTDPMHNVSKRTVNAQSGDDLTVRLIANGGFCTVIRMP